MDEELLRLESLKLAVQFSARQPSLADEDVVKIAERFYKSISTRRDGQPAPRPAKHRK